MINARRAVTGDKEAISSLPFCHVLLLRSELRHDEAGRHVTVYLVRLLSNKGEYPAACQGSEKMRWCAQRSAPARLLPRCGACTPPLMLASCQV